MKKRNPILAAAQQRRWRATHPDYNKNYYAAHKAALNEYARQYYLAHRARALQYQNAYYVKHKEAICAAKRLRHAIKKATEADS